MSDQQLNTQYGNIPEGLLARARRFLPARFLEVTLGGEAKPGVKPAPTRLWEPVRIRRGSIETYVFLHIDAKLKRFEIRSTLGKECSWTVEEHLLREAVGSKGRYVGLRFDVETLSLNRQDLETAFHKLRALRN